LNSVHGACGYTPTNPPPPQKKRERFSMIDIV
jgi:hypothetical protein